METSRTFASSYGPGQKQKKLHYMPMYRHIYTSTYFKEMHKLICDAGYTPFRTPIQNRIEPENLKFRP